MFRFSSSMIWFIGFSLNFWLISLFFQGAQAPGAVPQGYHVGEALLRYGEMWFLILLIAPFGAWVTDRKRMSPHGSVSRICSFGFWGHLLTGFVGITPPFVTRILFGEEVIARLEGFLISILGLALLWMVAYLVFPWGWRWSRSNVMLA